MLLPLNSKPKAASKVETAGVEAKKKKNGDREGQKR